jgi:hypothetical protein
MHRKPQASAQALSLGPLDAATFHPDSRQPIYLPSGPFAEFRGLVPKHHLALERELAGDEPEPPYPLDDYQLGMAD